MKDVAPLTPLFFNVSSFSSARWGSVAPVPCLPAVRRRKTQLLIHNEDERCEGKGLCSCAEMHGKAAWVHGDSLIDVTGRE